VVFVGEHPILFPALARQGWHVTEAITTSSICGCRGSRSATSRWNRGDGNWCHDESAGISCRNTEEDQRLCMCRYRCLSVFLVIFLQEPSSLRV
jgi:hypothetical protein